MKDFLTTEERLDGLLGPARLSVTIDYSEILKEEADKQSRAVTWFYLKLIAVLVLIEAALLWKAFSIIFGE
jgi:hypothetical protein